MESEILWLFIRLVIVLPLVLALAYFFIRYGLARSRSFTLGSKYMRIVEHLPLGAKGGLALVELGGKFYLVAFQEHSISLLKEYDAMPEPLASQGSGQAPMASFKDMLNRKIK